MSPENMSWGKGYHCHMGAGRVHTCPFWHRADGRMQLSCHAACRVTCVANCSHASHADKPLTKIVIFTRSFSFPVQLQILPTTPPQWNSWHQLHTCRYHTAKLPPSLLTFTVAHFTARGHTVTLVLIFRYKIKSPFHIADLHGHVSAEREHLNIESNSPASIRHAESRTHYLTACQTPEGSKCSKTIISHLPLMWIFLLSYLKVQYNKASTVCIYIF